MSRFLPRIEKEKNQVRVNLIEGIIIRNSKKNPRFIVLIIGFPFSSNFGYRSHLLEVFLPPDYPLHPPRVLFKNKIFHPNVDFFGRPCLDILKDQWSPAFQLRTVILSLQTFIQSFGFLDPLNHKIKNLFRKKAYRICLFCKLLELVSLL